MTDRETWAEQRERLEWLTRTHAADLRSSGAIRGALERIDALEEAVATKDRALSAAVDELREAKTHWSVKFSKMVHPTQYAAAMVVVEAAREARELLVDTQAGAEATMSLHGALARFDALRGGGKP